MFLDLLLIQSNCVDLKICQDACPSVLDLWPGPSLAMRHEASANNRAIRRASAQGVPDHGCVLLLTFIFSTFPRAMFRNICIGSQLKQHFQIRVTSSSNNSCNVWSSCCFLLKNALARGAVKETREREIVINIRVGRQFPPTCF